MRQGTQSELLVVNTKDFGHLAKMKIKDMQKLGQLFELENELLLQQNWSKARLLLETKLSLTVCYL